MRARHPDAGTARHPAGAGPPRHAGMAPGSHLPELTTSTFTLCGWWQANLSSYASMAWVSEDFWHLRRAAREHPHPARSAAFA